MQGDSSASSKSEEVIKNAQQIGRTVQRTAARKQFPKFNFNPENKIKELLATTETPSLALSHVWQLQDQYGNANLFALLAQRFYVQNFGVVTPHLNKLFKQVALLNAPQVEAQFIKKMYFLAQNQKLILQELTSYKVPRVNIRIRYAGDVEKITAQNFTPHKLILSVEQRMNPVTEKDFPVRHVNAKSVLETSSGRYAVYQYAGPMDLIPALYRYLLNGSQRRVPVTLVFDEHAQSLAMYNADKSLWLRVTPHEYENANKLHIHLNEKRTVLFIDESGKQHTVPVNINLSIPLLPPDNLPAEKTAMQRFLYEKLVLHPVKNMQNDARVTLERRSIF